MKLIRQEFIFDQNAPTPECHASTVAVLENGRLAAAWFGGTKEAAKDVAIWVSLRDEQGWSDPVCVSDEPGIPHWNPVLFPWDEDTLCLFYKAGHTIPDWKTMVVESHDGGKTWTHPRELVEGDTSGGRGPVKNKAIRTKSGVVLAPASRETDRSSVPCAWRAFVDVYGEHGWQKHPIPVAPQWEANMIQPTLWEMPEGHIHALLRTNAGKIFRSDSEDDGMTWSSAYPTDMPNNNSGLDAALLYNGTLALVCNPDDSDWGRRYPLSVYLSDDNGQNFFKAVDLETEEGEFSYPAVAAEGNRLHITYTWKRKKIAYCCLEV